MSTEGQDGERSTADQSPETPVRTKSLASSVSKPVIFAVDSGAESFLRARLVRFKLTKPAN